MIKNCAHPNCAWKWDQSKYVCPPILLSPRDRLQPICLCFISCHCLDLLFQCTFSNTQQSAVRARHTQKKTPPKTKNWKITFTINSFDEVNWHCSSAVEVSYAAICYDVPTPEKKLTHQEMICQRPDSPREKEKERERERDRMLEGGGGGGGVISRGEDWLTDWGEGEGEEACMKAEWWGGRGKREN